MAFCPKCKTGTSGAARFCASCGEKLGVVEKRSEAKKAVSASPSNGLRSKEEANKADNDRVERALFKDNGVAKNPFKAEKGEGKPAAAAPAPVTFGDFVFKLVSLPGPVILAYDDGEVIFSSKGKSEVNTELPVKRKGPAKGVKVVLKVPEMGFVANLSYNLSDGNYVTLEATEEGLKNSQLKLK